MSIDELLQDIFSDLLKRRVAADENVTRQAEAAWDSLKHMELVFAVEDEFGVRFSEADIATLDSRAAFARRIASLAT